MNVYLHVLLNITCMPDTQDKSYRGSWATIWVIETEPGSSTRVSCALNCHLFFWMSRWRWVTVWTHNRGSCPASNLWDARTNEDRLYTGNNCPKWQKAKATEAAFPLPACPVLWGGWGEAKEKQSTKWASELLSHGETQKRLSWSEGHREFLFFYKLHKMAWSLNKHVLNVMCFRKELFIG